MRAVDVKEWSERWQSKDEKQRRKCIKELYEIYCNKWREKIEAYLQELFTEDTWEDLRPQISEDLNPLRWASDELGKIYAKSPHRSIDGVEVPEDGDDPLAPYLANGTLDLALDAAARVCFGCRSVALRLLVANMPKEGEPTPKHKPHAVLDVIPTNKLLAIPDDTDMTRLKLVVVSKKDGYIAWDKDEVVTTDLDFNITDQSTNPYGLIPYVVAHAAYPATDYWSTSDANGLRDASYMVAAHATEHNHLRRLQSHKQGWFRSDGDDITVSVVTDPARWLHLRGDGEAGVLDMRVDLEMHLNSLLDRAAATLALYGIRPESVRGTLSGESGYALSLKLLSQEMAWGQQRRLWQVWEQRLYEVAREVMQVDASITLPEGQIKIDWAEIGAEATPMDQAEYFKILREDKWVSKGWVRRQLGLTPDEIEQIEEELLEEGAGMMAPPLMGPPQASGSMPPPTPPIDPEDDEPEEGRVDA